MEEVPLPPDQASQENAPGWYFDPADTTGSNQRYYDGQAWTQSVRKVVASSGEPATGLLASIVQNQSLTVQQLVAWSLLLCGLGFATGAGLLLMSILGSSDFRFIGALGRTAQLAGFGIMFVSLLGGLLAIAVAKVDQVRE